MRKGIGSRYPRSKPSLPTRQRTSYRHQFHAAAFFRALLRPRLGPGRPTPEAPNRGVEGAPRKQVCHASTGRRDSGSSAWRAHIFSRRPRAVGGSRSHGPSVRGVRHPRTRAHQTRERQDRRNGSVVLQKSTRGSILLLVRPPTCLKPHRWFQPPAWRLSTNLHRPRAQVEFSIATSFATNWVREKAGSAELKRDESVAHKRSSVSTKPIGGRPKS